MPRGGKREGAGKKNTWKSGCKFEDTKVIRVPVLISDKVLEAAHKIDAGRDLEKEILSLKDDKSKLERQLEDLNTRQLELPLSQSYDKSYLESLRNDLLNDIPYGQQSKCYKVCKKALTLFIDKLLEN